MAVAGGSSTSAAVAGKCLVCLEKPEGDLEREDVSIGVLVRQAGCWVRPGGSRGYRGGRGRGPGWGPRPSGPAGHFGALRLLDGQATLVSSASGCLISGAARLLLHYSVQRAA